MSSNSIDDIENNDPSSDLDDAKFEAYFARKFKKMWNKKKVFPKKKAFPKKDSTNPKAVTKGKFVPKTERNKTKGASKPIQCYECQGFGHTVAKCVNRKEKSKGKVLNVVWDEESNDEVPEPDSPSSESGKFIAFMALSNCQALTQA